MLRVLFEVLCLLRERGALCGRLQYPPPLRLGMREVAGQPGGDIPPLSPRRRYEYKYMRTYDTTTCTSEHALAPRGHVDHPVRPPGQPSSMNPPSSNVGAAPDGFGGHNARFVRLVRPQLSQIALHGSPRMYGDELCTSRRARALYIAISACFRCAPPLCRPDPAMRPAGAKRDAVSPRPQHGGI